ncbi:hypothetical protein [Glycomyces sp. NPDC047010]|uniref:hypothetical protein n=1 Tax=Glycomyces sp. NPDC047010 TaxID=3155023 RepID=UPI0033CE1F59
MLIHPVPRPLRPRSIAAARRYAWLHAAAALLLGFNPWLMFYVAYGMPLMSLFSRATDDLGIGFLCAFGVGVVWSIGHTVLLDTWILRADRRARPAAVVGAVMPVAMLLLAPATIGWDWFAVPLVTCAPSIIFQAFLLRNIFSKEAASWFSGEWAVAPEP